MCIDGSRALRNARVYKSVLHPLQIQTQLTAASFVFTASPVTMWRTGKSFTLTTHAAFRIASKWTSMESALVAVAACFLAIRVSWETTNSIEVLMEIHQYPSGNQTRQWKIYSLYPLVNVYVCLRSYGKSPFSSWVNPLFLWPFSIAMLVITRG